MKTRVIVIAGFIAVLLIASLSTTVYYLFSRVNELETQNGELIAIANDSARVAKTYRDENNMLHSHNKVLMVERDVARKLEEFAWIKAEGVNKKLKNLTQTTKIETRIDTVLKVRVDTVDAPGMDQILLDDKYNYVAIDSAGVNLTLKIEAPIEGVVYWTRKHKFWFLRWGKKEYFSDFTCLNPIVHVSNHEVIQVRRK